jgi:pseudouridine synthase
VKVRLHQYLSRTGRFSSKREAKDAVWAGEIRVAGSVVKDIAFQFNANTKSVEWNGELLHLPGLHRTFVLNKPAGVICSRLNKQERALGKRSVFEVLKEDLDDSTFDRMLTVGRLDEATTGLLILTTDGHLVHSIASPEAKVEKTYAVTTDTPVQPSDIERLRNGVQIELEVDGVVQHYDTLPADVHMEDEVVLMTISEGKKRQVRRMFSALGYEVLALHRRSVGGLHLGLLDLGEGEFVAMDERLLRQTVFEGS